MECNYLRFSGMASTPENNGLSVDRSGVYDCTTALNVWLQALVRNGDVGELGAGSFRTSSTLVAAGGKSLRLSGNGAQSSMIMPTGNTYPAFEVNLTGNQFVPSGILSGIGIIGPSPRPVNGQAGILLNQTSLFKLEDIDVQNEDIGFDFINDCYDSSGWNLSVSRFGTCNVGINIRAGAQSGSDLKFFNTNLSPWLHAVSIAGLGGGYSFFGGQWGANNSISSDANGIAMLCWDYVSQEVVGSVVNLLVEGVGLEGWQGCHAIRSYDEVQARFSSMSFNASQSTPGLQALDIFKGTAMKNSIVAFESCNATGVFSNAQLGSVEGQWASPLRQSNWYVPPSGYTANGVGKGNPLTDITAV